MTSYLFNSCLTVAFPEVVWREDVLIPTPQLLFPYDKRNFCKGMTGSNTNICLSWYPIAEATTYLLEWSFNPDFNGPSVQEQILTAPITQYCFTAPFQIRQDQTVYWRVTAANLLEGGVSDQSQVRSFNYNCNNSTNTPTGCDEYSVGIQVKGKDCLDSCQLANYSAEVTYSCSENPLDPLLISIKDQYWTYTYDGGSVTTADTGTNTSAFATLNETSTNLFVASLVVEELPAQTTKLCFKVVFEFPNDETKDDFECEGCLSIFVDAGNPASGNATPIALVDELISSDTLLKPQVSETPIDGTTEYFIRGGVYQSSCENEWPCGSPCACDKSKVSINGTELEIGDVLDFYNPCCEGNENTNLTLTDVEYNGECDQVTITLSESGEIDHVLVFDCCCNDAVVTTSNGTIVEPFLLAPIDQTINCPSEAPLCETIEFRPYLVLVDDTDCGLSIDINNEITCVEGATEVTDSITLTLDDSCVAQDFEYLYAIGACEITTTFTVTPVQPPDQTIILQCDDTEVVVSLVDGQYTDLLPNPPACDCLPTRVTATIQVESQTAVGVFELDSLITGLYNPVVLPEIVINGDIYQLNSLSFDPECNFLGRSNSPVVDVFEPITITNCDPLEGTTIFTNALNGLPLDMNVTIGDETNCGLISKKYLEARTSLPLDCSLKKNGKYFGIDHEKLVGYPNNYFQLTNNGNCISISPPVCECIGENKVYKNTSYMGTPSSNIAVGATGMMDVVINAIPVVFDVENLGPYEIESGTKVLINITDNCEKVAHGLVPLIECCEPCDLSELFISFDNSGIFTYVLLTPSLNGAGGIVHTIQLTCIADGISGPVVLPALDCDIIDCQVLDLTGVFIGSCDIGVINFGNDASCLPSIGPCIDPTPLVACIPFDPMQVGGDYGVTIGNTVGAKREVQFTWTPVSSLEADSCYAYSGYHEFDTQICDDQIFGVEILGITTADACVSIDYEYLVYLKCGGIITSSSVETINIIQATDLSSTGRETTLIDITTNNPRDHLNDLEITTGGFNDYLPACVPACACNMDEDSGIHQLSPYGRLHLSQYTLDMGTIWGDELITLDVNHAYTGPAVVAPNEQLTPDNSTVWEGSGTATLTSMACFDPLFGPIPSGVYDVEIRLISAEDPAMPGTLITNTYYGLFIDLYQLGVFQVTIVDQMSYDCVAQTFGGSSPASTTCGQGNFTIT